MLPEEFKPGIDKLVGVFSPRGWDAVSEAVYFGVVRRWSVAEWDSVIHQCLTTMKYMPKPKELVDLQGQGKARSYETFDSCHCCNAGLIPFTVEKFGRTYDKVCACSCESGKARVERKHGKRRMLMYSEIFKEEPRALNQEIVGEISDKVRAMLSETSLERAKGTKSLDQYYGDADDETPISTDGLPF